MKCNRFCDYLGKRIEGKSKSKPKLLVHKTQVGVKPENTTVGQNFRVGYNFTIIFNFLYIFVFFLEKKNLEIEVYFCKLFEPGWALATPE
jgi:hypothetical protein